MNDPDQLLEASTAAAPRDAAYRVLLVEDDAADTLLFQHGVGEIDPDLSITTASSLDDAQAELAGELDCVVLDLGLPGSIDLDALHAVRSSAPDTAVVVLTGWGDESVGTAAVAAGAQDYLIKGEAAPPTIARSIRFAIERSATSCRPPCCCGRSCRTSSVSASNERCSRHRASAEPTSRGPRSTRQLAPAW